jgi:hypothetical protein
MGIVNAAVQNTPLDMALPIMAIQQLMDQIADKAHKRHKKCKPLFKGRFFIESFLKPEAVTRINNDEKHSNANKRPSLNDLGSYLRE